MLDNTLRHRSDGLRAPSSCGTIAAVTSRVDFAVEPILEALRTEVVAGLPERLQELLGYGIHPPFVGYVDGRHPRRYVQ